MEETEIEIFKDLQSAMHGILDEYTLKSKQSKNYEIINEDLYLSLKKRTYVDFQDGNFVKRKFRPMSSGNFLIPLIVKINARLNEIVEDGLKNIKTKVVKSYTHYIKTMETSFGQNKSQEDELRVRIG